MQGDIMKKQFFAKAVRWKVDSDYKAKLSPTDRKWLEAYNDAEYSNDFRALDKIQKVPTKTKQAMTNDRNAARRDIFNLEQRADHVKEAVLEIVANGATPLSTLAEHAKIVAIKARTAGMKGKK
jgi:hypothetical protein